MLLQKARDIIDTICHFATNSMKGPGSISSGHCSRVTFKIVVVVCSTSGQVFSSSTGRKKERYHVSTAISFNSTLPFTLPAQILKSK